MPNRPDARPQPALPPSAVTALRADYEQRELLARVLVGRAPLSALDEAAAEWRVQLSAMLLEQGVPPDRVDRELVGFLRRSARSIRRVVGDPPPRPEMRSAPLFVATAIRVYCRAPGRARRRRSPKRSRFTSSAGDGEDPAPPTATGSRRTCSSCDASAPSSGCMVARDVAGPAPLERRSR